MKPKLHTVYGSLNNLHGETQWRRQHHALGCFCDVKIALNKGQFWKNTGQIAIDCGQGSPSIKTQKPDLQQNGLDQNVFLP